MRLLKLCLAVVIALSTLVTSTGAQKEDISEYIQALTDPTWTVRRDAAVALGEMGSAAVDAIPALTEALEDEIWYVRASAARALGQIGPEGVPGLIKALQDSDKNVRVNAARGLEMIGAEAADAVPALVAALNDNDPDVLIAAADALGRIGPKASEAVPDLALLLGASDIRVAWPARRALMRIGSGSPIRDLIGLVKNKEATVEKRLTACKALGYAGATDFEEIVSAFVSILKDEDKRIREMAASKLGQLGPKAKAAVPALIEGLSDADQNVRAAVASALKQTGAELDPEIQKVVFALDQYDHLRQQVNIAVETVMGWQMYGPEWDEAVAAGKAPAMMTGATPFGGGRSYSWTKDQWKTELHRQITSGNLAGMNVLALLARAYCGSWSRFYQDDEMVSRVVKGLDFYCIMQGLNGGFANIHQDWIGGPVRQRANHCLEGFGQVALGEAFLLLHQAIEEKGLLDEKIDNDDNPDTPDVTRREAYIQLFQGSRDYLTSGVGRGHAPNQDNANIIAMYLSNRSLEMLAPEKAWPEEKALEYVYSAVGLLPDVYGGYWVSPKGLVMEPNGSSNGGYCGNYGSGTVHLITRLAELTDDVNVKKRAVDAINAFANFLYPSTDADGRRVLRKEDVINWRNNFNPGRVNYGLDIYGALGLKVPAAIREAQLFLEDGCVYDIDLSNVDAHYLGRAKEAIDILENINALYELPATDYRLPMEPGTKDFAFADEMAGTVVVKHGDVSMYMALNWRHGVRGSRSPANAVVNNIARVHYTTSDIKRIANVEMNSIDGFAGFWRVKYGNYLVGMNRSSDKTYDLEIPEGYDMAVDLISGKAYESETNPKVAPLTTLVLYLRATE